MAGIFLDVGLAIALVSVCGLIVGLLFAVMKGLEVDDIKARLRRWPPSSRRKPEAVQRRKP